MDRMNTRIDDDKVEVSSTLVVAAAVVADNEQRGEKPAQEELEWEDVQAAPRSHLKLMISTR